MLAPCSGGIKQDLGWQRSGQRVEGVGRWREQPMCDLQKSHYFEVYNWQYSNRGTNDENFLYIYKVKGKENIYITGKNGRTFVREVILYRVSVTYFCYENINLLVLCLGKISQGGNREFSRAMRFVCDQNIYLNVNSSFGFLLY